MLLYKTLHCGIPNAILYCPGHKQVGAATGSAGGFTEAGGRARLRTVNPKGVWLWTVAPRTDGAAPRRALRSPRVAGRRVTASRENPSAKAESITRGAGARCASAVSLVSSLLSLCLHLPVCLSEYRVYLSIHLGDLYCTSNLYMANALKEQIY